MPTTTSASDSMRSLWITPTEAPGRKEELAHARLPLLHEEALVHEDERAPAQLRREVEGEHRLAVPAREHHHAPLGVGGGGEALLVGAHAALLLILRYKKSLRIK